ncbi:pimeloyl-ACP methyl ester carboxylesterase [Actinoplanes couchii]|uniref:AB hydrolase-1 domain-containing protein n=1 Tax=Actinoplanes couchii TaxID=403638 RepID=A0ABQ3XU64_9ACTN|nr:pimeloyl-ACP methyl ester carboxylesterase [Actinoplanes couchii]GID62057.1 hypothetical protein Aco03nite_104610 [Actinoplanes couchii]
MTLSCLVGGTGPDVVVLLHGLAGSAREMLPTAAALVDEHLVIVPDLRGHGRSTRRPADLSRRAYADDVAAVIGQLSGGQAVTLAGQSMGGHTALLTAAWHPDLVRRLVLLEAGVGGPPGADYPARLGDWFASWPVPFPDAAAAADFLGGTPIAAAWISDLEQRADGLWPRFDADIMRAAITEVAATARWAEWESLTAPVLLVTGERGLIDEPEVQRMLASGPEVTHTIVADAGHDVHLDQPHAWVRLLKDFIRDVGWSAWRALD